MTFYVLLIELCVLHNTNEKIYSSVVLIEKDDFRFALAIPGEEKAFGYG